MIHPIEVLRKKLLNKPSGYKFHVTLRWRDDNKRKLLWRLVKIGIYKPLGKNTFEKV